MSQYLTEIFWELMKTISFGLVRKEHRELKWLILFTYASLIVIFVLMVAFTKQLPVPPL